MSQDMKDLGRNIILLGISFYLAYLSSYYFGIYYFSLFPEMSGASFIFPQSSVNFLRGSPLSFVFFLTLLFTAFGGRGKYWWMGILLIPAAAFEFYLDRAHLYIPIALALFGGGVGWAIALLLKLLFPKK